MPVNKMRVITPLLATIFLAISLNSSPCKATFLDCVTKRGTKNCHEPKSQGKSDSNHESVCNLAQVHPVADTNVEENENWKEADTIDSDHANEFGVKCFVKRKTSYRGVPELHFFPWSAHSDETRNCGPNVEIKLKSIDGKKSDKPELNTSELKALLIDSNLFKPNAQTYFIIHGFMSFWNKRPWMCALKDLVLDNGAANVFIVDWSGGSKPGMPFDYTAAVSSTPYVGSLLGQFIGSLIDLSGQQDASHYHIIGHSLGAHIGGYAGYHLGGTLGRITALDPAGPCFKAGPKTMATAVEDGYLDDAGGRRRLSRQSAKLVVALHTDAKMLGLKESCAHYDVYVNGGYKQPECGPINSGSKCGGILSMHLYEHFKVQFGCHHRYAYKLLTKFVNNMHHWHTKDPTSIVAKNDHAALDKCYPVAYKCANWKAYKAGECGFCKDNDGLCIFIGLKVVSDYETTKLNNLLEFEQQSATSQLAPDHNDDDDKFNDEQEEEEVEGEEEGGGAKEQIKTNEAGEAENESIIEKDISGKYFMRSGTIPMTCMFQYQIIVAVKRRRVGQLDEIGKHYYYLHIPLELSGKLTDEHGNKLHDRLVQVSHKLARNSAASNYIKSTYMGAIEDRHGSAFGLESRDRLEFFTASITFEQVKEVEKCRDNATNGAKRKSKWQICNPLDSIQEARLWSSSNSKLDSVAWVGLNYMSGPSYELRMKQSYVFKRDLNEPVKSRAEIDKSSQAKLKRSAISMRSSFAIKMESAAKSIDCLLSIFDSGANKDAKRKFKCTRSRKELLYAIDLQPIKLG